MLQRAGINRIAPIHQCNPTFLCCDLQSAFSKNIGSFQKGIFVAQRFLQFTALFPTQCRYIITEQYPKGLGHTDPAIISTAARLFPPPQGSSAPFGAPVSLFEKTQFSMWTPDVQAAVAAPLAQPVGERTIVLFGVEAHACVQQTVWDLLENPPAENDGRQTIYVVADGVFSQRDEDRKFALKLFQKLPNVVVTTSESILLDLLRDAKHPKFRDVSKMLREAPPSPPPQS